VLKDCGRPGDVLRHVHSHFGHSHFGHSHFGPFPLRPSLSCVGPFPARTIPTWSQPDSHLGRFPLRPIPASAYSHLGRFPT
jgi:hypothetical protein